MVVTDNAMCNYCLNFFVWHHAHNCWHSCFHKLQPSISFVKESQFQVLYCAQVVPFSLNSINQFMVFWVEFARLCKSFVVYNDWVLLGHLHMGILMHMCLVRMLQYLCVLWSVGFVLLNLIFLWFDLGGLKSRWILKQCDLSVECIGHCVTRHLK